LTSKNSLPDCLLDKHDLTEKWYGSLHWVLCKLGLTSKHQPSANPSCGSGWTNKSQL
jgi:hypothetical protein